LSVSKAGERVPTGSIQPFNRAEKSEWNFWPDQQKNLAPKIKIIIKILLSNFDLINNKIY
jgi:hypothetical protein